jgi:hypothetical protein
MRSLVFDSQAKVKSVRKRVNSIIWPPFGDDDGRYDMRLGKAERVEYEGRSRAKIGRCSGEGQVQKHITFAYKLLNHGIPLPINSLASTISFN